MVRTDGRDGHHSRWFGPLDEFPVSSLLALEAVQAARTQSEAAAERLDLELRKAFFVRSRCITMLNEVLAAARSCDLDVVVPEVVSDDPSTVRDLVAQAAGSFIEEGPHDSRG